MLTETDQAWLGIRAIPNARITQDVEVLELTSRQKRVVGFILVLMPLLEVMLHLLSLVAKLRPTSAAIPAHIWLPEAMSAPTPASAYLHSATMVKAGIYLMARLNPILGQTEIWFCC